MKNPELFVKSVDTLVDAYEKGKLRHLTACNCAVGNLIAYSAKTYNYDSVTGGDNTAWVHLMNRIRDKVLVNINEINDIPVDPEDLKDRSLDELKEDRKRLMDGFKQAELTGYTPNEIERIEAAFEKNEIRSCGIGYPERGSEKHSDPLQGLLNAVKVLGDIHEIPDETVRCMQDKIVTKNYKKSFDLIDPEESEELEYFDHNDPEQVMRFLVRAMNQDNPSEYLEKRGII